jgi:hypothetical protein
MLTDAPADRRGSRLMPALSRKKALLVAILAAMTVVPAAGGCSSSSTSSGDGGASAGGGGLAASCTLDTDCTDPLVCIFGLCHQQCAASRDCPAGELCASVAGNGVCELPQEASCSANGAPCPGGLVCAPDLECRTACSSVAECLTDQACTGGTCYDPGEGADAAADSPTSG